MSHPEMPPFLSVSLVVYKPDMQKLSATLGSFVSAVEALNSSWDVQRYVHFVVVDNGCGEDADSVDELLLKELGKVQGVVARIISGHGNVGFGCGHNLALTDGLGRFHIILNPDLEMASDSLLEALAFMESHPECGLLTPAAFWEDGSRQYLCKRYPSLLDLILRGFAPGFVKSIFKGRLERYEMRDMPYDNVFWDPPIVSGCFMLFRGDVLQRLEGFDPQFFLYFEDFDLSLRSSAISRSAYVPSVKVVHYGGNAARKGCKHIRMFGESALTFFGKHGWRWL